MRELQGGVNSVALNGLIMISPAFDMAVVDGQDNDAAFATVVPTFAATAWYHKALPEQPKELDPFLAEVTSSSRRSTCRRSSPAARWATSGAPRSSTSSIATPASRADYLRRANLKVSTDRFRRELLRERGLVVGRLDARYTGTEPDAVGETPSGDPMDAGISGAFVSVFMDYLRTNLGVKVDREYVAMSGEAGSAWKRPKSLESAFQGYVDVTPDLARGMADNPQLRVFIANGLYDVATSFFASEYEVQRSTMDLKRVELHRFPAGHMMYVHHPTRAALVEGDAGVRREAVRARSARYNIAFQQPDRERSLKMQLIAATLVTMATFQSSHGPDQHDSACARAGEGQARDRRVGLRQARGWTRRVRPARASTSTPTAAGSRRRRSPTTSRTTACSRCSRDRSDERTKEIILGAHGEPGSESQKIADYYESFMDEAAIEAKGIKPIQAELAKIAAIKDVERPGRGVRRESRASSGPSPFSTVVAQDDRDPEVYIANIGQGGLGLPDRDMYDAEDEAVRGGRATATRSTSRRCSTLVGAKDADKRAAAVYALEEKIAATHWTRVENRDPQKTYNKLTIAELQKTAPGIDWKPWLDGRRPRRPARGQRRTSRRRSPGPARSSRASRSRCGRTT